MSTIALCVPLIRTDYIERYIETLYKYTDDFRLFVCDQSVGGMDPKLIRKYVHWYVRPYHNLGFSKACNELMWTAYRQGYPYIAACNDDVEYMYKGWLEDALSEFETDEKIMVVCPESPRVAMWGYGLNHGEHLDVVPHKEEFTKEDIEYLKSGDYNKDEMQSRHEFVIPDSFPVTKRGVVDGVAMWHPIFKRECLEKVGYLDEKFMYGGGEDYDYNARAYRMKYRMVSTMKSWVWHWWGQSKDQVAKLPPELFDRPFWNNLDELWPRELNFGQGVDPWGHATNPENGEKIPFKRIPQVLIDKL